MSRASWLALLCVLVLALSPFVAQGQSSTPSSQVSEPLWQALLPIAETLPNSYDLFIANLTSQVDVLTTNNGSLASSNLALQTSNNSLTLENVALRASLKASKEAEATSENKSMLLQKDLSDSIASTIRAQGEAKALEAQVGLLRIGCITLGVTVGAIAVYEGGHLLKVW